MYTFLERSPLKWKFLRLSSAQVKICKISYVNFEKTSRFLSIFLSLFSLMKDYSSVPFLAQTIYTLLPIKMKIFVTSKCLGQILSNCLGQFWNDESIPLQILYPSSVSCSIIPRYFFTSNVMYFAEKEPIEMKFFETFECSGQILSNLLCQFWNDEFIPVEVLYPSSVSWEITPLYFF